MNGGQVSTLEQKKDRRGVLALLGAGGAAALAALLPRSGAHAGHDGTNIFHLGKDNTAVSGSVTKRTANLNSAAFHVVNNNSGLFADAIVTQANGDGAFGVWGQGLGNNGVGVKGNSVSGVGVDGFSTSGTGVKGISASSAGVRGQGKPGVYGLSSSGSGVRGDGTGAGTVGVYARNNAARRALRTRGRVQMDCARKKKLSAKDNLLTLPAGVQAGTNAIILAMVQGPPGNGAFVRRAFRVDATRIRIQFNKKPANPTAVGYWVVHTG